MKEFQYVCAKIFWRIAIITVIFAMIYNPYMSLYQLVLPSGLTSIYDIFDGWLYKLIGVVVAGGLVILFVRTTKASMGKWGVLVLSICLGLVSYLPFYAGLVAVTQEHIFYTVYYFFMPWLLGIGLATGYITRWMNGTLIVTNTESDNDHNSYTQTDHTKD